MRCGNWRSYFHKQIRTLFGKMLGKVQGSNSILCWERGMDRGSLWRIEIGWQRGDRVQQYSVGVLVIFPTSESRFRAALQAAWDWKVFQLPLLCPTEGIGSAKSVVGRVSHPFKQKKDRSSNFFKQMFKLCTTQHRSPPHCFHHMRSQIQHWGNEDVCTATIFRAHA